MKHFYDLDVHEGKHSLYVHKWNPYWLRAHTPLLDWRWFNAHNVMDAAELVHTIPELCFMGCLDAPWDIPLGATARVKTVDGWEREEYLHAPRDCTDWNRRMWATAETAVMLRQILKETED